MDDLVRTLDGLGIVPIGSDDAPTIWTELRTVPGGKPPAATVVDEDQPVLDRAEASSGVRIGDVVQVQTGADARVRIVRLTANRHDPELGVISVQHPSGAALLGAHEDDEIEFEIDHRVHRWLVLKVDRETAMAATF